MPKTIRCSEPGMATQLAIDVLWYFNDVWRSGIILIGEESMPVWVIVIYAIGGSMVISAVALPFLRARLRKAQR